MNLNPSLPISRVSFTIFPRSAWKFARSVYMSSVLPSLFSGICENGSTNNVTLTNMPIKIGTLPCDCPNATRKAGYDRVEEQSRGQGMSMKMSALLSFGESKTIGFGECSARVTEMAPGYGWLAHFRNAGQDQVREQHSKSA